MTGPDLDELVVPSVGAGISRAQTAAATHLLDDGNEWTYYVRDLLDKAHARVTKLANERAVETLTL